MARALHADITRERIFFGWIVMHDQPEYPDKFVTRLVTDHPTIYVMLADTLAELRAMLPPDLDRSERQLGDPPAVIEIWFSR